MTTDNEQTGGEASKPRRRWRWLVGGGILAVIVVLAVAPGCAHRPVNARETHVDPAAGYRFANTPAQPGNSNDIFVILAFSGGGTRAAAFSFGALEALDGVKFDWHGQPRSLLDETDIISSVSGGSFTAAYYGLHGKAALKDFPEKFLYKNITLDLGLSVLNPLNWPRLASADFSRIDLAAELYDRELFGGATFADLAAVHSRPFIVLNATDMTYVSRFEFTQDQFDFLSSDLSSYHIARGVAASSAFPGLLTPLTVYDYQPAPGYVRPQWLNDAADNRAAAPREYAYALAMGSYLGSDRPYVHLMDGGLADNIGLRGPAYALTSVQNPWNLVDYLNSGKIKYLVVVTVNAKPGGVTKIDQKEKTPGLLSVFSVVANGPMGNYSSETVQYLADVFEQRRQNNAIAKYLKRAAPFADVKYYAAELTFEDMPDPKERDYLNALPTSFNLPREAIDRLRAAAKTLLLNSPDIQRLQSDLAQAGTTAAPEK
ncbi:MAG TPA: patatin-like phospholipase family protein [Opitutus sp.]|nr:patatin-like phospholipase family protein [Opitutus sp.]